MGELDINGEGDNIKMNLTDRLSAHQVAFKYVKECRFVSEKWRKYKPGFQSGDKGDLEAFQLFLHESAVCCQS